MIKRKNSLIIFFLILFMQSCETSNEELINQLRSSIEKEIANNNQDIFGSDTRIINIELVKKSEHEFTGILTTHESSNYFKNFSKTKNKQIEIECDYDIDVVVDGESFQYNIENKRIKTIK